MVASKCIFPKAGVNFPLKKFLSKISDTGTGTTIDEYCTDVCNPALKSLLSHFTKYNKLH